MISEAAFLVADAHNVVRFSTYASFVIGEVLILLDEIADDVCTRLSLDPSGFPPSTRFGSFGEYWDEMKDLVGTH